MNNVKPWYASRTVWINVLFVALAALDALQLLPAVPPGWAPYILAAQGFLNVVLRLTTSSGIAGFAPVADPMRPTPAPPDAPPAGAAGPSLAARLSADYGLPPEPPQGEKEAP